MTPSHARAVRARLAVEGFMTLGTNATPAIPALRNIIDSTKSPDAADKALSACCYIGNEALPVFTQIITNSQHPQRLTALAICTNIRPLGTNTAELELIHALEVCTLDPNPRIAEGAGIALPILTNRAPPQIFTIPSPSR